MRERPLHGYLAYRSIRDYLAQHGLGLIVGEADPLPTAAERTALVFDERRMQQLIEQANKVPLDERLPPVTLNGNELGLADFYYWAFEIFGLKIQSLSIFYYCILSISAALFFFTFRRSPFCLYLLMLYLIGHFYMLGYGRAWIYTVHNSRFFPVLALLPTMHLLLLVLRGHRATPTIVAAAAIQVFVLYFCVFCRLQALWQPLAVIVSPLVLISFGSLRQIAKVAMAALSKLTNPVPPSAKPSQRRLATSFEPEPLEKGAVGNAGQTSGIVHVRRDLLQGLRRRPAIRHLWPAAVSLVGLISFVFYMSVAFDRHYYATEARTHTFWDPLYVGTVSASPQLLKLYGEGAEPYSDTMGYLALIHDLRERNEIPPEIGYVSNKLIWIDPYKNMGIYDSLMRRAFFDVVFAHPWLTLKSLVFDKPHDQLEMFSHTILAHAASYVVPFAMALAATIAALVCGASLRLHRKLSRAAKPLLLVAICSSATTLVIPSRLIPDTILYFLLLATLLLVFVPLAALWNFTRNHRFGTRSSPILRRASLDRSAVQTTSLLPHSGSKTLLPGRKTSSALNR